MLFSKSVNLILRVIMLSVTMMLLSAFADWSQPVMAAGPVGSTAGYTTMTGPVSLTAGQTLSNVRISNPSGDCVRIDGQNGAKITIQNAIIGPCGGSGIDGNGSSNITVKNVLFQNISTSYTPTNGHDEAAFQLFGPTGDIYFGENSIIDVQRSIGPLQNQNRGFHLSSNDNVGRPTIRNITVELNEFRNTGFNFVQIVGYTVINGIVSANKGENDSGATDAEDIVNFCASSGTADSPIVVIGNVFKGGGPSDSGTGTILGDCEGDYQHAIDNIYVNPGQVGIGVYGGYGHVVRGNKVYSAQFPWTNVGIYAWDGHPPYGCGDITIENNEVDWTNRDGSPNPFWAPTNPDGGVSCVTDGFKESGNNFDASLDESIFGTAVKGGTITAEFGEVVLQDPEVADFVFPEPVESETINLGSTGTCGSNSLDDCEIRNTLQTIVNFSAASILPLLVILLVIAGIRYSAANGNSSRIEGSKTMIYRVATALVSFMFLWVFLQWLIPGGVFS